MTIDNTARPELFYQALLEQRLLYDAVQLTTTADDCYCIHIVGTVAGTRVAGNLVLGQVMPTTAKILYSNFLSKLPDGRDFVGIPLTAPGGPVVRISALERLRLEKDGETWVLHIVGPQDVPLAEVRHRNPDALRLSAENLARDLKRPEIDHVNAGAPVWVWDAHDWTRRKMVLLRMLQAPHPVPTRAELEAEVTAMLTAKMHGGFVNADQTETTMTSTPFIRVTLLPGGAGTPSRPYQVRLDLLMEAALEVRRYPREDVQEVTPLTAGIAELQHRLNTEAF